MQDSRKRPVVFIGKLSYGKKVLAAARRGVFAGWGGRGAELKAGSECMVVLENGALLAVGHVRGGSSAEQQIVATWVAPTVESAPRLPQALHEKLKRAPRPFPRTWLTYLVLGQETPGGVLDRQWIEAVLSLAGQGFASRAEPVPAKEDKKPPAAPTAATPKRGSGERTVVPDRLTNPHPLVVQTRMLLKERKAMHGDPLSAPSGDGLDMAVGSKSLNRALRIMDTLIKALERKGFRVSVSTKHYKRETTVLVNGESIQVRLREHIMRTDHQLTPEEQTEKALGRSLWAPRWDYHPTGDLTLSIESYSTVRRNWSDGKRKRLENCVDSFIEGLVDAATRERERRLEQEESKRRWAEEQRRREEELKRQKAEQERVELLREQAALWHESQQIRTFVEAVKTIALQRHGTIEPGGELDLWVLWARAQADRLDPLAPTQGGDSSPQPE